MTTRKHLARSQRAPDFEMVDMSGKNIKLSDFAHKKLLLCFFRYASCPWCNLALHRLTLEAPRLQSEGLQVIAFIQSKPENIKKYIYGRHQPVPPFPIIADPERHVYDLYGVDDSLVAGVRSATKIPAWLRSTIGLRFKQGKVDGSLSLVPAQFLIGPYDFKIHSVDYGADYFHDISMIKLLEFAQFEQV